MAPGKHREPHLLPVNLGDGEVRIPRYPLSWLLFGSTAKVNGRC